MTLSRAVNSLHRYQIEAMDCPAWARTFGVPVDVVDELVSRRLKDLDDLELLRRREEAPRD